MALLKQLARSPKGSWREAGFTLVEVMVAGAVGIIGLYATLNLAVMALKGNSERRDLQAAGQLAEHVLSTIQAEGTMWTGDGNPNLILPYLGKLPSPPTAGATTGWLNGPNLPQATDKRVGAMGGDIKYDQGVLQEIPSDRGTRYCMHFRLTWLSTELVRAEVKVSWPRPIVALDKYANCPVGMYDNIAEVNSVALPALVQRNSNVQ